MGLGREVGEGYDFYYYVICFREKIDCNGKDCRLYMRVVLESWGGDVLSFFFVIDDDEEFFIDMFVYGCGDVMFF